MGNGSSDTQSLEDGVVGRCSVCAFGQSSAELSEKMQMVLLLLMVLTFGAGVHAWRPLVGGCGLGTVRVWVDVSGSLPYDAGQALVRQWSGAECSPDKIPATGVPKWRVKSNQYLPKLN